MRKEFQEFSEYSQFDVDNDGVITDQELELAKRAHQIHDLHEKESAKRAMCWFTLAGVLFYPALVVFCDFAQLLTAAKILGDLAPTFFVSTSAIVVGFFSAEAFITKKTGGN